jgi:tRNA/rRNA methyltransferase
LTLTGHIRCTVLPLLGLSLSLIYDIFWGRMVALGDRIRIILMAPAGARNVGSIARVMKNMGLSQLWLVNPACDWLGEESRHMAVHAADLLETVQVAESLTAALAGCGVALATIGRESDRAIVSPREGMAQLVETVAGSELQGAIIFGREDHGLSNADLDQSQIYVSIPTSADYQSLNLAQAVGILAYELQLAIGGAIEPVVAVGEPVADLAQVEGYFQDLELLLLEIGYLQAHTAAARMAKLRDLLRRGGPTAIDVAMLRGMIRQVKWAVRSDEK